MKIKFATDLIIIAFEQNEPFSDHSVVMFGEVLHNGFAAFLSTMRWDSPEKEGAVSAEDKKSICELVQKHNSNSKFFVDLVED